MMYHKQLNKHDPDNDQWGDCYRTSIACILDLHPEEVPHFFDGYIIDIEAIHKRVNDWLSTKGFGQAMFAFDSLNWSLGDILAFMGRINPKVLYILCGISPIANHAVVARGGDIIHDPSLTNDNPKEALMGPSSDGYYWIEVIYKQVSWPYGT